MKHEIKIIRIGGPEVPFENFDAPFNPLTEEELADIQKGAKEALIVMLGEETIKLSNELKMLQKLIAKQKSLTTYKPGDVTLGQRVKDIKAELKKRWNK